MKKSEVMRFAKIVEGNIEFRWGKGWRAMLSAEMQSELVKAAVTSLVLGWVEADRVPSSDVQEIARAALQLIVPETRKTS